MEAKKRFSIVIPTYQNRKQLGNTLEVLKWQKDVPADDYEVVVVDDGSTDGTGEHIKGLNHKYQLKYIYLDRRAESSRSKARNTGIMAAEGEIIVFLDADMLVKQDYLSRLNSYFKFNKDILVIGHRIMLTREITDEDLSKDSMFDSEKFKINGFENFELRHSLFLGTSFNSRCNKYPWIHVFSCNMAVRRELLDSSGYFDEDFKGWGMEDVELGYRLHKTGAKIITGIQIEAFHQQHSFLADNKTPEEKEKEIDANTMHFIKKHPEAMKLPVPVIIMFFKGNASLDIDKDSRLKKKVRIDFRDKADLEKVKQRILKLSRSRFNKVKVYDYIEDTDLDIWIQLLEGTKTTPKYFPMVKGQALEPFTGDASCPTRFEIYKRFVKTFFVKMRYKIFRAEKQE